MKKEVKEKQKYRNRAQVSAFVILAVFLMIFIGVLVYVQQNKVSDVDMKSFNEETGRFNAQAISCMKDISKSVMASGLNDSGSVQESLKSNSDECFNADNFENLKIRVSPPLLAEVVETGEEFKVQVLLKTLLSRENFSENIEKYSFSIAFDELNNFEISDSYIVGDVDNSPGEEILPTKIIVEYYNYPDNATDYENFLKTLPITNRKFVYDDKLVDIYSFNEEVQNIIIDMSSDEFLIFDNSNISYEEIKQGLLKFDFVKNVTMSNIYYSKDYRDVYVMRNHLKNEETSLNDEYFLFQWYLNNEGQFFGKDGVDINIEDAWKKTKGNSGVIISVIDQGIFSNEDYKNNIFYEKSYDVLDNDKNVYPGDPMEYHGTHVTGVIASDIDNKIGIAGICPKCKVINMRIFSANGYTDTEGLVNAILLSISNKADIISMSLSGPSYSSYEAKLFKSLYGQKVIFVAAAGNNGSDVKEYPSGYEGVIGVGATDNTDKIAYFSNYGDWVDIYAPGESIISACGDNIYCFSSGTSMATPVVSGVIGLMKSLNNDLTTDQIVSILTKTGESLEDAGNSKRINAGMAIKNISMSVGDKNVSEETNKTDVYDRIIQMRGTRKRISSSY